MCHSDIGSCCPLLGCRVLLMFTCLQDGKWRVKGFTTCSFQGEKNKLNKIQINEKWFLCRNKLHLHTPQGGSSTGCVCVYSRDVVQRDDTKPSFVSLLEDPLSVWLAALWFMRTCVSHCCRSLETLSASGLGGWTEAPRHSAAVKWAIVLLMLRRAVTQTWGGNGLLKYMQSTTRCLWSPGNSTGPTVHAGNTA